MKTLFDLQRTFDQDDKFRHFTVGRTSNGEYQAAYARSNSSGYSIGVSDDLAEAIQQALIEYDSQVGFVNKVTGKPFPSKNAEVIETTHRRVRDDDGLI